MAMAMTTSIEKNSTPIKEVNKQSLLLFTKGNKLH